MRQFMMTVMALSALFAVSGKARAEVNYPWCIIGDTRTIECYFSSREQCAQDGRNRGFGSQCMPNPFYKPGAPTVSGEKRTVSQNTRPSQTVSAAHQSVSTCTGLKSVCISYPYRVYATRFAQNVVPNASFAREYFESYRFGLKRLRPGLEIYCNDRWEQCMKTGWWEGYALHRAAERR
jgi:hypothetical protein